MMNNMLFPWNSKTYRCESFKQIIFDNRGVSEKHDITSLRIPETDLYHMKSSENIIVTFFMQSQKTRCDLPSVLEIRSSFFPLFPFIPSKYVSKTVIESL